MSPHLVILLIDPPTPNEKPLPKYLDTVIVEREGKIFQWSSALKYSSKIVSLNNPPSPEGYASTAFTPRLICHGLFLSCALVLPIANTSNIANNNRLRFFIFK